MSVDTAGDDRLTPAAAGVLTAVRAQRVVGIVRTGDPVTARRTALALLDAGLGAVEVSLTTPDALEAIATLAADGHVVGAGTVVTVEQCRDALASGAAFVVSPTLDREVVRFAPAEGAFAVPGTVTPTEALTAVRAGAPLVKVFPASLWTPAVLRDVLVALPDLPLIATGGVAVDDAPRWWRAGAVAVGLGSALSRGGDDEVRARVATLLAGDASPG